MDREMELEKVVEPERVVVQVNASGTMPPGSSGDRGYENEFGGFADEVYIFVNPNEPGIKFIDSTPNSQIVKLTGTNPDGIYTTDLSSIDVVEWDEDINTPNETIEIRYANGPVKIRTIMVSEETLKAILQDIDRQMAEGATIITIDIKILTRNKEKQENIIEKNDKFLNDKELNNFTDEYANNDLKTDKTSNVDELSNDAHLLDRYKKLYNEVKNIQDYIDIDDKKLNLDQLNKDNDINDLKFK